MIGSWVAIETKDGNLSHQEYVQFDREDDTNIKYKETFFNKIITLHFLILVN